MNTLKRRYCSAYRKGKGVAGGGGGGGGEGEGGALVEDTIQCTVSPSKTMHGISLKNILTN